MIIGTAGHIDHGKTALVRALTGVDTDRLEEEKRRGITIELGFAHLALPGGRVAGVVDVPGHERFVKAMASGAGGVDLVLLVVAADEGVMPQTREHLDICRLLGVRGGVVVLTKADLLEGLGREWEALLRADVAELCAGTFLEGAPVLPVSSRTGAGLEALVAELSRQAAALPARPGEGPALLPVDRAFTLKGHGTVVTGTLLSGALAVDDAVSLLPALPGPFRVRALQVHGRPVPQAAAGARVAVNLAGVEAVAVERGAVLVREGEVPATRALDVEVAALPAAERALPRRSRWRVHLGTRQVEGTLALLGPDALAPGETALGRLRLAAPVAALPGQRFILRGSRALPGRGATVAGGRILSTTPPRRRRRAAAGEGAAGAAGAEGAGGGPAAELALLREADLEGRLRWHLRQAGWAGLTQGALFGRLGGVGQKALGRALELASARGLALLVDREKRLYVGAEALEGLTRRALALLADHHAREPLSEGLPREELRQRLSGALEPRLFARVLAALCEGGGPGAGAAEGREAPAEADGERVRLKGRGPSLSAPESLVRGRMVEALALAALAPPTVAELARAHGLPAPRVHELLRTAAGDGLVVRVSDELYFDAGALAGLRERLVAHLQAHRDITTQAFKELVGQTRKFVIPLSEYFDREKVTLRVGDKRVLRRA